MDHKRFQRIMRGRKPLVVFWDFTKRKEFPAAQLYGMAGLFVLDRKLYEEQKLKSNKD